MAFVSIGSACDGDDADALPDCVAIQPAGCAQLYPPNFEQVWANTLMPTCASGGGSCHESAAAEGAQPGGLALQNADDSHARLLDGGYVVPGDAACSTMVVRLEVDDAARRMPPGTAGLDVRERCSIETWIAEGAGR